MDDLGFRLKRAREAQGVSLKDIALRTKISVTALEALERNDFSKLPGGIFGRAFVRAYALEVGLDPDTTVQDFIGQLGRSEQEAAERDAVRVEITDDDREFLERQRRAIWWLRVVAVVIAIAIVTGVTLRLRSFWLKRHAATQTTVAQDSAAPPPATPPTAPAPATLAPVAAAPPATGSTPPSLPSAAAAPSAPAGLTIDLIMTGDCWISVAADGARPTSDLLHAGQTRTIHADREIALDVGNAGAVTWTINGKTAKPMGKPGEPVHLRVDSATAHTFVQ